MNNWAILPECLLLAWALVLATVWRKKMMASSVVELLRFSGGVMCAMMALAYVGYGGVSTIFFNDTLAYFFKFAILLTLGAMIILISNSEPLKGRDAAFLYITALGCMIVAGGNELSALFLGVCLALISSTVFQWLSDSDPLKRLDIKKWFAVTSVSLAVLAFGMAFLYGLSATTQIVQGKVTMAVVHLTNENIGVILVIVEVLLLVGVAGILLPLPFSNMSGLRSGGALISMRDVCRFLMMATVGLLLFAKLFANELSAFQGPEMSPNDWGILASVAAILTMLLAPYYAMKSTDIVATAMWLSLSHIGYAWQLWIWLNPKSITAAGFLQLSLLAPLFLLGLLSRTVRFRTGDGSGASAIGLWHRSPLVAGVFIVGLVSFVGAPATIGYTARYLLIQSSWSTIDLNSFGLWGYITFVACVVSSVLTVAAVIPWMRAIFTEGKADHSRDWRGMEKVMAIALACLIIGFGLYSQPLYSAASTLPTSFGFLQP